MKNRGIVILFTFIWCFIVTGGRLAYIALGDRYVAAAEHQSLYTVTVDAPRGTVYDRDMNPMTNRQPIYLAAMTATPQVISAVHDAFDGEEEARLLEKLSQRKPFVTRVPAGFSAPGATVFICSDKSPSVQPAIHVIGYLDAAGEKGIGGLQQVFEELLTCGQKTTVTYHCDAAGGVLTGVEGDSVQNGSAQRKGVMTTLELAVQLAAEQAFPEETRGAVIVQRRGSGELAAVMSAPSYSPRRLAEAMEDKTLPMLNRAFCAYNVGSVFKLCVAAAALEQGLSVQRSYCCTGSIRAGETFHCHKQDGHGTLTMEEALAVSCNTYFIDLAREIGGEAVYDMAVRMGFGEQTDLCDGMTAPAGNLPSLQELLQSPAALANFAIGQGVLLATPLQVAAMTNAIADGGIYFSPYLLMGTVDGHGRPTYTKAGTGRRIFSARTAQQLQAMMERVMTVGTGVKGLSVAVSSAGKTATAQTGMVDEKGVPVTQAWFTGYFPAEDPDYAVTVLVEGGSSGGSDAAPIFKALCEAMVSSQRAQ